MDWNTYQNEPSELDLYPENQLVKTNKVPSKDYMVRVVNMLNKKYIRDLLENGRPKLHYKDEQGKRHSLNKSPQISHQVLSQAEVRLIYPT